MTEVVCPGPVLPGTHPAFSFGAATETAAQRKCGSTEATSHKFKYFSSINHSAGNYVKRRVGLFTSGLNTKLDDANML